MRRDSRGRIIGYNWWRELVVSSWSFAHISWWEKREAEAMGYDEEEKLFAEEYPQPTLKEFMIGLKGKEEL